MLDFEEKKEGLPLEEAENKEINTDNSSETNVVVKKRTRKKKIRVEPMTIASAGRARFGPKLMPMAD